MKKYQAMIVTCTLCAVAAGPAFGQVTGGPNPSSKSTPSQQAPTGTRPDSATGSTSLPGTAAPGTPTDDKSKTLGRQDPKAPGAGMPGSQATRTRETRGSGMSDGQQNASPEQVRQIQEALKAEGQNPGPIDGVMGARTQEALRAYQSSKKLNVTGRLDAETMEKLGVSGAKAK